MGVLDRLMLGDDQWERMSAHIIGYERTRGSSGRDNRMFVEAVLWIARTGSPGAICPTYSARGTASSGGSAGDDGDVWTTLLSRRC